MIYHPEDFEALSNQVEYENGELLSQPCEGKPLRYRLKVRNGKYKWDRTRTCNCGNSSLMLIPFNPKLHIRLFDEDEPDVVIVDHEGEEDLPAGNVKVCAVDDAVGLWPRYSGIITDRSYQV